MSNFKNIQSKLEEFVKKYYTNELIKGLILFSSFGLLYFIFTLLLEHFLWLQPTLRTLLFWIFVLVELLLLVKYIIIPIAKLLGLQKGISLEDASKIIGSHFKQVDDKLLNILQLQENLSQSELLFASIDQKAKGLQPIPFKRAIDFTSNKKYLKYLAIPIVIWFAVFISGNTAVFSDSYDRVLHHQVAYEPPAPFSFYVLNDNLDVIEGKPLKLNIETRGEIIPEDVQVHFLNQNYYLQSNGLGSFEYTFSNVQKPIQFYFEANGIQSKEYSVNLIEAPLITNLTLSLDYPNYTRKRDEVVKSTGNVVIPSGTKVIWSLATQNTDQISFISSKREEFEMKSQNKFQFKKSVLNNLDYQITTSNEQLKDYESLNYNIQVVKDEYPKIAIKTDLDSVFRGSIQFAGQLSDDYGLQGLNIVYYDINNKESLLKYPLKVNNSTFEEFYYLFPDGIDLIEGIEYEIYFEVFDNDAVIGNKRAKSSIFKYYNKTEKELQNQLLKEQQNSIDDLKKSLEKAKKVKEEFQNMQQNLQNKSQMDWNDQKKLETFVKRHQEYEKMMQRQTEQIQQNLEELPKSKNKSLEERKKEIQQRLKEAKDISKQEKLLEQLEKLAEKLDKENLTDKLKKLTEENKQNERSLERILELTKRFYVEQKMNQIKEKLDELAKKQEELAKNDENTSEKQKKLNEEFDDIKKDIDQLNKDNKELQKPMHLPETKKEETGVKEDQEKATKNLEESEKIDSENDDGEKQEEEINEDSDTESKKEKKKTASKKQKSAAQKIKKMSGKMSESMVAMEGESMEEDIASLRAILENLVEFSFQQEDLLGNFSKIDNSHPEFANNLKKQHVLKEYFEHIDDSLYTLSMRQPKISSSIYKDLSNVHYFLDESLSHFTEDQFNTGLSDQQFVMTSTNNLAYLLSNILNSMQNAQPSMGEGQGKGKSFSLPDIIQKQGEMIEKMQQGMKPGEEKGKKPGEKGENGSKGKGNEGKNGQQPGQGDGDKMSGEIYEIYKEQSKLRQLLEDAFRDINGNKGAVKNSLDKMEKLEQDLLNKGFSNEVLQKMMELKHELLKLEKAAQEQGQDDQRESNSNQQLFEKRNIKDLDRKKLWFNQNEILNRQSLPLQSIYKKKVQEYFKHNDSIQ